MFYQPANLCDTYILNAQNLAWNFNINGEQNTLIVQTGLHQQL